MKVVIVGAGIAGLSVGWRLLQAGAEVLILERAQPARGATWAAAGMISVTGGHEAADPAEGELARCSAKAWPEFAAEIEVQSGHFIGYRKTGKLVVAADDAALARFAGRVTEAADLSLLSGEETHGFEPLLPPDISGALWDPEEAQVDNRALGDALVQLYLRAGGVLQSNETVVRFECDETRIYGVRTPFGLHEGDAYVLAAGAWTSRILGLPPDALPPVIPVKGEIIALQGDARPARIIWGNGVYLVPRNELLLVGATVSEDGFDTSLTEEAERWLLASARGVIPSLAKWSVVDHWAGLRPGSPDNLPMLGRSTIEGLFVASGQFRNGILFAPVIAHVLAAAIMGRPVEFNIAAFDPRRFSKAALANARSVG